MTPSSVRFSVSLPTIMDTAFLAPGRSPSFSFPYTFRLSADRHLAARIWKHQNVSSRSRSAGWILPARKSRANGTRNASRAVITQSTPPAATRWAPHTFLNCRSAHEIQFPMSRTGWYSQTGSPNRRSKSKPAPQAASDISIFPSPPSCSFTRSCGCAAGSLFRSSIPLRLPLQDIRIHFLPASHKRNALPLPSGRVPP